MKPTKSAGTDSVFLATSAEQIESAFLAIHGTVSQLRTRNDAVLLKAFVEGDEYIVDTVSSDGEHFVVDIWRYHKVRINGGFFIYDTIELLPAEGEAQSQLVPYVKKVLEALHIAYGPAHSEVILTKKAGSR